MAWLIAHWDVASGLAFGAVSESLAIWQALKYPTNAGFGGFLVAAYKALKSIGATKPQDPQV